MARIDALFNMMKEQGASDLHLSTGNPPIFRLHGEMVRLNFKALGHDELKAILFEILNEKQKEHFERDQGSGFCLCSAGTGPFPRQYHDAVSRHCRRLPHHPHQDSFG